MVPTGRDGGMAHADKPLDAGTGRVCGSFDAGTAGWLSLGATHAEHGFVELSNVPAFDEAHRGDPAATRRHRDEMLDRRHAVLSIEVDGAPPRLRPELADPARPRWSGDGVEVEVDVQTDATSLRQTWRIASRSDGAAAVRLRLRGRLDRPALAEITETDPPPPTSATTLLSPDARGIVIDAAALPASARLTVHGAPVSWAIQGGGAVGDLEPRFGDGEHAFVLELGMSAQDHVPGDAAPPPPPTSGDRLVGRALAYVRGCTALRVELDERVILTDHRALPLSWTRDAYWQALALLAADGPGDGARVADHLRWLWRRCERPDGHWARSHHANGRRKDLAYQADQQLYPLLELCDAFRLTGDLPSGVGWSEAVARAWSGILEGVDPDVGLVASAENAADDPAAAPFIAANQILLWYAAERLAELGEAVGVDADDLRASAAAVRAAFARHIAGVEGPWAYAVDGQGGRVVYHDANDLPVALAPLWGFCSSDDPGWRATMAAAFGPDNPAWVDGRRPGLGSLHTPGPWTLGDLQAWIGARAVGDAAGMASVLERLEEVAFDDGMLPEAYGTEDDTRIRTWFAWPGAVLAALQLFDRDGRLEPMLRARPR